MDKHPKSLSIFFAAEMWERYGFYVVQSLLALYLALHFQWPDKQIYALLGSFTALTYLSPLIGGWIADNLIGQKLSILLGAFVLFISYCLLSFAEHHLALTASLAGIAVGTGLLKPNISSLLGNEYLIDSPRRESGFTIFYMGINAGIVLGTTIPSQLNEHYGWKTSFISAAFGMIIAFLVFVYGIIQYKIQDYNPFIFQYKKIIFAFGLMMLLWILSFYVLNSPQLANLVFSAVVLFSSGYIFYSVRKEDAVQSRLTLIIGLFCLISIMFWSFYFQMFMSLTLFISRVVQPTLYGIPFPAPYYVTMQSIGLLIIGFYLSKRYPQLTLVQRGLSTGKKFVLALLCTTLAYGIIAGVCTFVDKSLLISPLLIIPAYLMLSLAELLLSPVGLAAITVLSDKNKVSTMMGIFFVSLGIGGFLSGKLANLAAIPPGESNLLVLKTMYAHAFTQQLGILFLAMLACLAIFGAIKYLLKKC